MTTHTKLQDSADQAWVSKSGERQGNLPFTMPSSIFGELDSIIPVKYMNLGLKNLSPNAGSATGCGTLGKVPGFWVCVLSCFKMASLSENETIKMGMS